MFRFLIISTTMIKVNALQNDFSISVAEIAFCDFNGLMICVTQKEQKKITIKVSKKLFPLFPFLRISELKRNSFII